MFMDMSVTALCYIAKKKEIIYQLTQVQEQRPRARNLPRFSWYCFSVFIWFSSESFLSAWRSDHVLSPERVVELRLEVFDSDLCIGGLIDIFVN
jgi:hypothetical protein